MQQSLSNDDVDILPPRPDPIIYSNPQIRPNAYYSRGEAEALTRLSRRDFGQWSMEAGGPKPSIVAGKEVFLGADLIRAQLNAVRGDAA